jgi:putative hydrolase of the HAD superfamily
MQVLIFDLDDTLYAEREYVQSGFKAVDHYAADELQISGFGARAVELFESGRRGDIFHAVLNQMGVNEGVADIVARMVVVYRNHIPQIKLFPDAADALPRLATIARLGIITDGYLPAQRFKVSALGLGTLCNPIFYTEEFGREYWKPSPRAYLAAEVVCSAEPNQCVYIGDNPRKDFTFPNSRGWRTVRIVRPGTEHAGALAEPHQQPGFTIGGFGALEELVNRKFVD